jgi:hypothetical protein
MEYKTCTIKELYEHFKAIGKEDYKLYVECLTVSGDTTNACIVLQNIIVNDEDKKIIL